MPQLLRTSLLATLVLLTACAAPQPQHSTDTLSRFESESEAIAYVQAREEALRRLQRLTREYRRQYLEESREESRALSVEPPPVVESTTAEEPTTEGAPAPLEEAIVAGIRSSAPEGITNNQEAGVDEGGIVKRYGDYLVVLRRGVLYSIRVGAVLEKADEIPVQPASWNHDAWYDEILIHDGLLIVTGYSYDTEMSEYIFIRINEDGTLNWRGAYFMDAGDYYSGNNYASRLIGDNLIFYMTDVELQAIDQDQSTYDSRKTHDFTDLESYFKEYYGGSPLSPLALKFDSNGLPEKIHPLFSQNDVYSPILSDHGLSATVIAICPLREEELSCRAISLLGGGVREHYATAEAYYLWMTGNEWNLEYEKMPEETLNHIARTNAQDRMRETVSALYRISFSDLTVGAVKMNGEPLDQFSFKETDGRLLVVTRQPDGAHRWFSPHYDAGHTFLAEVPFSQFTRRVHSLPSHYLHLIQTADDDRSRYINRFIDDKLVFVSAEYHSAMVSDVYIVPANEHQAPYIINTDFHVHQVHPIGRHALLIGEDHDGHLNYVTMNLSHTPFVADYLVESEGELAESRSHAFFYRADQASHGGLFGIPIAHPLYQRKREGGITYYLEGIVDMQFSRVSANLQLQPLGALQGSREEQWYSYSDCDVSCYDWYGSARPIFWEDRLLALLKYELLEGKLSGDFLEEIQRIDIRH